MFETDQGLNLRWKWCKEMRINMYLYIEDSKMKCDVIYNLYHIIRHHHHSAHLPCGAKPLRAFNYSIYLTLGSIIPNPQSLHMTPVHVQYDSTLGEKTNPSCSRIFVESQAIRSLGAVEGRVWLHMLTVPLPSGAPGSPAKMFVRTP